MKSTKPKTASLTKRDFDNATAQPWDGRTCLVAQFMIRNGIPVLDDMSPHSFAFTHDLRSVQAIFDDNFRSPNDKKKSRLRKLRASLPIKINLP